MGEVEGDKILNLKIYIGAETIVSPIGIGMEENFESLTDNRSGCTFFEGAGFKKENLHLAKFKGQAKNFDELLEQGFQELSQNCTKDIVQSERTLVLLSTTKGNLDASISDSIYPSAAALQKKFSLHHFPFVVSNGCASGVIAINLAADFIQSKKYDHLLVLGCDVLSDFVLFGFQSLFAVSAERCQPFDKNRKGINLGEAFAGLILSNSKDAIKDSSIQYLGGSSANDANHISGPSRTGEGLFRSITRSFERSGVSSKDIDFISAHGTGTLYNDDTESIAFNRMGLGNVPLNSLKAYYGHTLGAAGILETAVCLACMRENLLIKSLGFEEQGTPEKVNVILENKKTELRTVLKTVSGFGGFNSSIVLQKI